jgi:protein-ribulosamine 3-kinase
MLPQPLYNDLKKLLVQAYGTSCDDLQVQPVGGGSINQTYKLTFLKSHVLFCKVNNAATFPHLFLKEKHGLEALRKSRTVKTPGIVACATLQSYQLLLLEWIESGRKTPTFFEAFGKQLAALHQTTSETFGWEHDNYMGSVPQQNTPDREWTSFFIHRRLEPLVQQCLSKNLLSAREHGLFEELYQRLPQLFDDGEKPALLHGDLWSGNYLCSHQAEPVLIDPAVYYGHRCMDIAMTTLFGGFDKLFYDAYAHHFPLPKNDTEQLRLCNLYPLLVHLLLFGRSYLTPVQQTLLDFL